MQKTTTTLCVFLLFVATSLGQTVSTFPDGTPDDGIAIDVNGNIYASNFTGDTVFKYTPDGTVSSFITGLDTPNGLAFDNNGNLVVCDWNANTIYRYDSDGALLNSYAVEGNSSGIIRSFDGSSMIFTEYSGNKINLLESDGTVTPVSEANELNGPVGLAYDEAGVLYVGNYNNREIYKVESNGELSFIAQLPATGALPNLGFIAYAQGYLWGTILGTNKIYKINPNGTDDYEVFAGSTQGNEDGDISVATFNRPNGILFNTAQDKMYVTDFGSKNLRIISGVQLSVIGNDLKKNEIVVAPNPVTDLLKVAGRFEVGNTYAIKVYDMQGRKLMEQSFTGNGLQESIQISTAQWGNGTYLVAISNKEFYWAKSFVK